MGVRLKIGWGIRGRLFPMMNREIAFGKGALALSFVLTIFLVIPFAPGQPAPDFDSSWQYAMNVATVLGLRFGHAVMWTTGPLSAVYTWQYHPGTDELMLLVSAAIAIALFAGFTVLATMRRRPWLLLIPLFLGTQLLRDAQFMILPLLFVALIRRVNTHRRIDTLVTVWVAACCALLPLIKGNLTLLFFVSVLFGCASLWRSRRRFALSLICVQVLVLLAGWLVTGQRLFDLPAYFISQLAIVGGYTDAMANGSEPIELGAYIAIAVSIVAFAWRHRTMVRDYTFVFVALTLFVCFKMGFVRQDLHATIAASGLGLVGLLLFLDSSQRRSYVYLIGGLLGWSVVAAGHVHLSPSALLRQIGGEVESSATGAWTRWADPAALPLAFVHANERLALTTPLPVYAGSSDLYSSNLADLFANGARWAPRPIVQSTSAYTPSLLQLNLSHLENSPPDHVYFRPSPVDDRYPAFEDSESWPQLLRLFEPISMAGDYAVLGRRTMPAAVTIGAPIASATMALGSSMVLPTKDKLLWADIEIEPTLLGRFVSVVYRLPPLRMELTYPGQLKHAYRFVPGIARAGFLLSPTVIHAEDFLALASPQRERFLGAQRPISFVVDAPGGLHALWQSSYRVTLSPMLIPVNALVDAMLLSPSVLGPDSTQLVSGGDCAFDEPNGTPGDVQGNEVPPNIAHIRGWGMISAKQGKENTGVTVELQDDTGSVQRFQATRFPRSDVTMFFGLPFVSRSGFEISLDTQRLRGHYTISVIQSDGPRSFICSQKSHFDAEPPKT